MSIFDGFPRGVPGGSSRNALLATASWGLFANRWKPGLFWVGMDDEGHGVGFGDDRHIVTIAGSRSGKGRSGVIPNALSWPASMVVIDPKGENATKTAKRRAARAGHEVIVIDPRRAADVPEDLRGSFNPLDLIDADDDDAIDLAAAIGDALMVGSGDGKDVHWTESARQIIEALILYVAASEEGERRSLVRVRQLLTIGDPDKAIELYVRALGEETGDRHHPTPFEALWSGMSRNEARNENVRDVIAGAANSVIDMGENERGSVLSTARRNTKFIDSPWMRECLKGHGGKPLDTDGLKQREGGVSIYICLPARFIPTHARFLRMILNLILFRMEAQGLEQPRSGHPVLFILDEFAALGRLEAIEKAAGLMAGYGVKLWPIIQDLGQLQRDYKQSWETFLGNAGILQFFANADQTTLEWLSKRLGQIEIIRDTRGQSESETSSLSKSQSRTESSGWSQSKGSSSGESHMADLSRLAAQDGGSGFLPFLARSGASGTGSSVGHSEQAGKSGGESIQKGDSSSAGTSKTATRNEGIHLAALLNPDEIARLFDRETMRQIVFVRGVPFALWRVNHDCEDFARLMGEAAADCPP